MTEQPSAKVVDALPAMGKSHGAVIFAARNGQPVSVFTHIRENRKQLLKWAGDEDLEAMAAPVFTRHCPTAAGEHGEDARDRIRSVYDQQLHGREIHGLGIPWPCQAEGPCPYFSMWNFDVDDYDLVVGHPIHAKVPQLVEDRVVIFDEDVGDAFLTEIVGSRAEAAVDNWLDYVGTMVSGDSARDLMGMDPERSAGVIEAVGEDLRDPGAAMDREAIRADAPAVAYGLIAAEDLGNGFERAELPDGSVLVRNTNDESSHFGDVAIRSPPDLEDAAEVMALDGTPTMRVWRGRLGLDGLDRKRVFEDDKRRAFLTGTLGNRYVQTSRWPRPSAQGIRNESRAVSLITWVREVHGGSKPDLITTRAGVDQLVGDPKRLLEDTEYDGDGPAAGDVGDVRWFGLMKGMNDFKDHEFGVVLGSPHPGYGTIKRLAALDGHAIEPAGEDFEPKDWGEVGNQYRDHETVNKVVQAALRWGRDGTTSATVYVDSVLPEWFPSEERKIPEGGERRVLSALLATGAASTSELADRADLGQRATQKILNDLAVKGLVDRDPAPGPVATTWTPTWPPVDRS